MQLTNFYMKLCLHLMGRNDFEYFVKAAQGCSEQLRVSLRDMLEKFTQHSAINLNELKLVTYYLST